MMNKNQTSKDEAKAKKLKKKTKNKSFLETYFNHIVITAIVVLLAFVIVGQVRIYQLYRSVEELNLTNREMLRENQLLSDEINKQNSKLENIDTRFNQYLQESISREQFTEIYMQLQELTGMVTEENKREFYINRIVNIISSNNGQMESEKIYEIAKSIYETSMKYDFNPLLICALIKVESNFVIDAVSDSYAYGLCQVRRFIARELAENIGIKWDGAEKTLFNPEKNIKVGIYYLSLLFNDFGDIKLALTAYNHGPFKVQEIISQENEIPTVYVDKVLDYYAQYRGFNIEQVDDILLSKADIEREK